MSHVPAIYLETNGRTAYSCEIGIRDRVEIGGVEHSITVCAHRDTVAEAAADFRALVAEVPSVTRAIIQSRRGTPRPQAERAARSAIENAVRFLEQGAWPGLDGVSADEAVAFTKAAELLRRAAEGLAADAVELSSVEPF